MTVNHRSLALSVVLLASVAGVRGAHAAPGDRLPPPPRRLANVVHLWLDGEDDARLILRVGDMLVMRHLRSPGSPVRMFVDVPEGHGCWAEFQPSNSSFPQHDMVGNEVDVESVAVHLHDPSELSAGMVRHAGKGSPPDHPMAEVQ